MLNAVNNNWTGRELKEQINASLYEGLLMSNDKEAVLEPWQENKEFQIIQSGTCDVILQSYKDRFVISEAGITRCIITKSLCTV